MYLKLKPRIFSFSGHSKSYFVSNGGILISYSLFIVLSWSQKHWVAPVRDIYAFRKIYYPPVGKLL